jgi:plasmid stabilization system protein ParE
VRARDDLASILSYIAADNPGAAAQAVERIGVTAAGLADFPTGRPGRVMGTYEKVVARFPYIIAYEIVPQPDGVETINILHIIHTARDWPPGAWPDDT